MEVLGGYGPGGTDAPGGGIAGGAADGRGEVRKEGSADGGATFVKTELLGVDGSEKKQILVSAQSKFNY